MLDITPSAIEQLNYTQCYPIVIYLKMSNRRLIKQIREEYGKFYQKSSRRLLANCQDLESSYSYLFTSILKIDSTENWFELLKSQIDFEQEQPIWMSDDRSTRNDLLKSDEYFLSTTHPFDDEFHSNQYNSLQRVASDPSISYPNPISTMQTSTMSLPNRVRDLPRKDEIYRADRYVTIDQPKVSSTISLGPSRRAVPSMYSNDRLSSSDSSTSMKEKKSFHSLTKIKAEREDSMKKCRSNFHEENYSRSLEKPRVFTYDDRHMLNVLSSSSGSSTLSYKEKILKEVGETQ